MEKSLTKVQNKNTFDKIITFFKNMFTKKLKKEFEKSIECNKENEVSKNINIENKFNILNLQKQFEKGLINEEELKEEEKEQLILLYKEQIDNIKNNINFKKQELNKYKMEILNLKKK